MKGMDQMKRLLTCIAVVVVAAQTFADAPARLLERRLEGERLASAPWITRANVTVAADVAWGDVEALAREASGNRPIVLLETNYYTFLPGEPLELRMTVHPNGFTAPATMYLYRENRRSGEKRYYNMAGGGMMAAGAQADLFGTAGSPVRVVVPQLEDFVLFGSTGGSSPLSWGLNGALGGSISVPSGQTGLYQWVLEIRDASGKRVISRSNAMFSHIEQSVPVTGTLTTNTTWTANRRYVLNQFVGVAEPAVLTIEPGTVIYGGDGQATLFIQRGAKIIANGTERRPIIFTSPQRTGSRSQRDWGSLVLLGRAPINEPGGQGFLEGLPNQPAYAFGGTNAADDSGVLRYVRLEFGGFPIADNQEINGLTMAGVGNGTTIEYIQVLHNKDDAFEWFGGTVSGRYLLAVGHADDGLDWDLGWQGDVQFAAMIKRGVNDENDGNILIEADGHPQTFSLTPLSNPRVYNITGCGTGRTDLGHHGAVMRRGTAGKVYNAIIAGSRRAAVTIRDDATFGHAASGEFIIDSSIFAGDFSDAAFASNDRGAQTRSFLFQTMTRNRNADPMLAIGAPSHIRTLMPDLSPLPGSPALDADFVANPPDNGFFKQVDFIGAVGPGENWILSGWATFSEN
jgi:hypothetical protein